MTSHLFPGAPDWCGAADPLCVSAVSADAVSVAPTMQPGRTCPVGYRYKPSTFRRAPDLIADTLYVVGGLYGNRSALDAIEAMMMHETRHRPLPRLVFNGDFHWFDIQPPVFAEINRRVLHHVALRGNVETEIAGMDDNGCGCGYPDDVGDDEVTRSNAILKALRRTAHRFPALPPALASLPMHAVAKIGDARIAIVHGDAESLAGWNFDARRLHDPVRQPDLKETFRAAGVDVFASTHTCLPALRCLMVDGRHCAVINNGAAGMPNFRGAAHGVITRIATTPAPADLPVLHEASWRIGEEPFFVAALAVAYDDAAWRHQFESDWPAGSPAHLSYWQRISKGPDYGIDDAYRRSYPSQEP